MIIAVTCETCHEEYVTVAELVLYRVDEINDYVYAHRCRVTGVRMFHKANAQTVRVMTENGIQVHLLKVPKEFYEMHYGAEFTGDDMVTFQELLDDDFYLLMVLRRWMRELERHKEPN